MKTTAQISLIQDFYRDRVALLNRHVEGAKAVGDYEFNNTYQYIIERETAHASWVRDAITDLGGAVPTDIPTIAVPGGRNAEAAIIEDDVKQAQAFYDRWKDRIKDVTNARHATMLRVVLNEVLEHKRFFEQAKAGREDLLGRRMPGASTGDGVLPTRWMS